MGLEAFGLSERDGCVSEVIEAARRTLQDGRSFHEVGKREAGSIARGARGGEDVVGADDIIAEHFGRVGS